MKAILNKRCTFKVAFNVSQKPYCVDCKAELSQKGSGDLHDLSVEHVEKTGHRVVFGQLYYPNIEN